ncbi:hypothetical protein PMKS-002342 [Pichia membranifaciens]|uniref:Uncharacterized protein n=1 Tax=Pichia membranifaciens TaxID=4926 RepID=A0A1Q2YH52_9ASCO|nr:hypothetical protein PMKS-002342 [Pichia membranifaciens]
MTSGVAEFDNTSKGPIDRVVVVPVDDAAVEGADAVVVHQHAAGTVAEDAAAAGASGAGAHAVVVVRVLEVKVDVWVVLRVVHLRRRLSLGRPRRGEVRE